MTSEHRYCACDRYGRRPLVPGRAMGAKEALCVAASSSEGTGGEHVKKTPDYMHICGGCDL